jgi:hypothetical protein
MILIALCLAGQIQAQDFYKGTYYNNNGQGFPGLIKTRPGKDYIKWKSDKKGHTEKVNIKDISSIVISYNELAGPDSLIVLTEDGKENKRYFAKFLFATPNTKFYSKPTLVSVGGVPGMSTLSNVPNSTGTGVHSINQWSTSPRYIGTEQVTMYTDGNTTHELKKGNYIKVLSKAFADVPDLVKQIQKKKYKFNQLDDIINYYRNHTSYSGA